MGRMTEHYNDILTIYSIGYGFYPIGKQCRTRSTYTSMQADLDLCFVAHGIHRVSHIPWSRANS